MNFICIILAALSIWDYPARHPAHMQLRRHFIAALRAGDAAKMEAICQRGVSLLPDDPTWRYNLACSLAYYENRENAAFDALEKAKTELCKKSDHDLFLLCLHLSQRDPAAVRAAVTVCGNHS